LDPADVALSGIKQAEDGTGIVVRLVDVTGKGGPATLALPVRVKSAKRLDLIERPLKEAEIPAVRDRTVTVVLKPHEVATLGIHTAE
jgi:alpha-mannosidase